MRFICWILGGHKWISSIVPEFLQCDRCDKTRPAPPKDKVLPHGTRACPYPDCDGWSTPPPFKTFKNGNSYSIVSREYTCPKCKGKIRYERVKNKWHEYDNYWPDPVAILEFTE